MVISPENIRNNFNISINNNEPILGVAAGSGITARYAEKGGADFIMVLNAGIFRMSGLSSTAALMPYANANELVMEVGKNEILPRISDIPVFFGMCGTDTTIDIENYLYEIKKAGFAGVTNYPSVGILDGIFKTHLKENDLFYDMEVELIELAKNKGMYTSAFVFNEQQAIKMAQIKPDSICINFGWTRGGDQAPEDNITLDNAINKTKNIYDSIKRINTQIITFVYGGPINSPEAANYVFNETDIVGYIGGSVFERIPLEKEIVKTTKQYKMFTSLNKNSKRLRDELRKKKSFGQLVGKSKAMQNIYNIIDQIADKQVNVLITGESGTGKELVARAIHYYGEFSEEAFVPINTASIPFNLLESELFGHEKGSYTGADSSKKGKFEIADGGTIFLDEIGEMPEALQPKILRAIEEGQIQRIGSERDKKVDLRVISATNKDLRTLVNNGKFREDLFYRLNVVNINIPPLRDRKEDIPLLIEEFINENNKKYDKNIEDVTQAFFNCALEYNWPGNIRELKNAIERAYVLNNSERKYLSCKLLPEHIRKISDSSYSCDGEIKVENDSESLKDKLNILEEKLIRENLKKFDYNISRTSEKLGITRKTLRNKIEKYNLPRSE